jgi:para-aminobenzoate synthetase component I
MVPDISTASSDHDSLCVAIHEDSGLWATIGIGAKQAWVNFANPTKSLDKIEGLNQLEGRWVYHVLSYDLKNCIEDIKDRPGVKREMPISITVDPEWVIRFRIDQNDRAFEILQGHFTDQIQRCYEWMDNIRKAFKSDIVPKKDTTNTCLQPTIQKTQYDNALRRIHEHLQRGDIYEVNYCQSFEGTLEIRDPFSLWIDLLRQSHAPFACYCKFRNWTMLCASPERFLQRKGNVLISQPIKGTIRRGATPEEDETLRQQLLNSPKERSENVMIVDLVRNDLSRIAKKNTVRVRELFGAYRFKTVHHLISTIEAEIPSETNLIAILRATFPMGSMTGAPKVSAMQIAEQLEFLERGWYSGSLGFVSPEGDFDFNVIIRAIIANSETKKVTCAVGGAITHASDIDQEYDETLLKASMLRASLTT